ncbi:MAG: ATP-grasp domain-containing protein [Promethearchaeota archaeon]
MGRAKSVLIFEYISGGGIGSSKDFEFLIPEGFGMLSSLVTDFALSEFQIHTLIDCRVIEQFESNHQILLKINQLEYTKITHEDQITSQLTLLIPKFDYILIIAPEFSNILEKLVRKVEQQIQTHQIILNLPSEAISIFTDKLKTEFFLIRHGYNSPQSCKLANYSVIVDSAHHEYIIKPIDGVGAADTYSINLEIKSEGIDVVISDILKRSSNQNLLIQKKILGIPLSAFVSSQNGIVTYFTINSQQVKFSPLTSTMQTHQIEYLGGSTPFTDISSSIQRIIHDVASTICSQFKFTGFFGIDFIYDKNTNNYSITDINPRVTTPYVAISELFRENNNNIQNTIFSGKFTSSLKGKKSFKKTDQMNITLK